MCRCHILDGCFPHPAPFRRKKGRAADFSFCNAPFFSALFCNAPYFAVNASNAAGGAHGFQLFLAFIHHLIRAFENVAQLLVLPVQKRVTDRNDHGVFADIGLDFAVRFGEHFQKITLAKKKYTVKVGKTVKVKAKTVLVDKTKKQLSDAHAPEFRYASANNYIATVDKNGKIKGVAAGTCKIYVYSRNGLAKTVKITVK